MIYALHEVKTTLSIFIFPNYEMAGSINKCWWDF